jgi:hypothetical protein
VSSSRRSRIRGATVGDTRRRLEDLPRSRLHSAWGVRSSRGPPGVFSYSVSAAVRRIRSSAASSGAVGGDEETRTPDPLLAKEMLCQLSYVPDAGLGAWWAILDSNQRPLPYQGSALTS